MRIFAQEKPADIRFWVADTENNRAGIQICPADDRFYIADAQFCPADYKIQ